MGYTLAVAFCVIGTAQPAAQTTNATSAQIFEAYNSLDEASRESKWPDLSRSAREARRLTRLRLAEQIRQVDRSNLASQERLSLDIIQWDLQYALAAEPYDMYLGDLTSFAGGLHAGVFTLINGLPTHTTNDYETILQRIDEVPRLIDQFIDVLSEGLAAGYTQSRRTVRLVTDQLATQMAADAGSTRLLAAFRSFPVALPQEDQQRLLGRAGQAYRANFVPAWRKLHTFLTNTYMPAVREEGGLSTLPPGAPLYDVLVKRSTATSLTPQAIHDLGLRELERTEATMLRIAREGGFRGTLEEYDALQLATIEKTFRSKEEMLAFARNVAKMMEPELPRLFGRLPDIPFGIRAVPADREASASNNYSLPPDSLGPGWVNLRTYQPETYTKGETASVTLHEGIPGHHLQNAIQRRLQDAPAFRRYFGIAAFSEGWALYAEGLADDIGFLQDPDSRYGRLSGDRFRSARLVVDTGMHAMGWTRERALNYFKQHAPQARWAEIDRYLEMPAQALGYKIGQLKFRELRTLTEQALGPRFDLRAFHDTVLRNGDLPFDLLEQQVQKHIELARATAKP